MRTWLDWATLKPFSRRRSLGYNLAVAAARVSFILAVYAVLTAAALFNGWVWS